MRLGADVRSHESVVRRPVFDRVISHESVVRV